MAKPRPTYVGPKVGVGTFAPSSGGGCEQCLPTTANNGDTISWDGDSWEATAFPASLADGTILYSTLYWNGAAWKESGELLNNPNNLASTTLTDANQELQFLANTALELIGITNQNIPDAKDYSIVIDNANKQLLLSYTNTATGLLLRYLIDSIAQSIGVFANDVVNSKDYNAAYIDTAAQKITNSIEKAPLYRFSSVIDDALGFISLRYDDLAAAKSIEMRVDDALSIQMYRETTLLSEFDESRQTLRVNLNIKTLVINGSALISGVQTMYYSINNTSLAAMTVTLPGAIGLSAGDQLYFKDIAGNASLYNITINGNGVNIDNFGTLTINQNFGSLHLIYDGTKWGVFDVKFNNSVEVVTLPKTSFNTYYYEFTTTTGSTYITQHSTALGLNEIVSYRLDFVSMIGSPTTGGGYYAIGTGFRALGSATTVASLSFNGSDNHLHGAIGSYVRILANVILNTIEVQFKSANAPGLLNKYWTLKLTQIKRSL